MATLEGLLIYSTGQEKYSKRFTVNTFISIDSEDSEKIFKSSYEIWQPDCVVIIINSLSSRAYDFILQVSKLIYHIPKYFKSERLRH